MGGETNIELFEIYSYHVQSEEYDADARWHGKAEDRVGLLPAKSQQ